jgi:hypothetical protein
MFSPRRKKLSGEDIQRISMKKGGTRGEERKGKREGEGRGGGTRQDKTRQDKTKKQGKL